MHFDIIGEIENVEAIAAGSRIRELPRLEKMYGSGRWRKMKGKQRSVCGTREWSELRFTGTKHTASAEKNLKKNDILIEKSHD